MSYFKLKRAQSYALHPSLTQDPRQKPKLSHT